MAITKYSDSNFSPIFKRVWGEYSDNLYGTGAEDPIMAMIPKDFGKLRGYDPSGTMVFPVKVTFGGGTGYGQLPTANSSRYVQVKLDRKRAFARVNIDRETMIASKGRDAAFRDATSEEIEGKIRSFMRLQACSFWNNGTGIHGQFSGSGTGTAAAPVVTAINTGTYKFRQAFFEEGDYINVRQSGTTLLTSVWEITAVDTTTRAVTLGRISGADDLTAIGAGTHDVIIQNSLNNAPDGLKGAVEAASTWQGVTVQRRWRAYAQNAQLNSVNSPISVDFINRAQIQTNNISGEYCNVIAASAIQMEKLINRLGDLVRYTQVTSRQNEMTTKALIGFQAVSYQSAGGEVKILPSRYIEDDRLYGVNTEKIMMYHAQKPGWADDDGTVLLRMQDQTAYEARYESYYQTYINPAYQFYIYNLSTT